ncbi:DUF4874 domain-containing protein [Lachnospiraceae bacterium 42-17]|nr:DUF4874 domain-containing protein [Dorea sp.]
MQTRYKEKKGFQKAYFKESSRKLFNPGCGWYHIYTFQAEPKENIGRVEEETWLDEVCEGEALALVLINIGSFRACELSREAILHIEQILQFFQEKGKQMILRFVYDTKGVGMANEPSELSLVKRHMEQIGSILYRFLEDILVIQGIFVGSWGEMHGSKFLGDKDMHTLVHTLYKVTEGRCFLAVRTPAQMRRILKNPELSQGLKEKIALFNDGIFGSLTDLGTYGIAPGNQTGLDEKWVRKEELLWQEAHTEYVPNGGEVLGGLTLKGYGEAAEILRKMHVSYLNSIYHQDRLFEWKSEIIQKGCFKGLSGYDYIGAHLGYRFVVRDVKGAEKGGRELMIAVENTGFACLLEAADCFLTAEGGEGELYRYDIETDSCRWKSGQRIWLKALLPAERRHGSGLRIFLKLWRKRDGRALRFANEGSEESVFLGEYAEF